MIVHTACVSRLADVYNIRSTIRSLDNICRKLSSIRMGSIRNMTTTRFAAVSNVVNLFYREAGSRDNPTFSLLHGFLASPNQFRNLMTLLAPRYHLDCV